MEMNHSSTNLSAWNTHDWITRRLSLLPGHTLIEHGCHECGRSFVDECSTGERYAVHVSIFKLHRLSDEVTSKWLSQECPAARLMADDADRRTRFIGESPGTALGEITNEHGSQLAAKSKPLPAVAYATNSVANPSRQMPKRATRGSA
jgi:hypothetical protein